MRVRLRRLIEATVTLATGLALATASATSSGGAPPTVVSPASTSASVSDAPTWSPRTGITFNNPRGTRAQQLALITQINRAIDAAPKGSVIRMAQYRFDISSTAARLVAAHRRGVDVKLLIDDASVTRQVAMLRKALGTDRRKRSFLTTCERSCMSNVASVMHAKFFLFSTAGKAKQVSMVSSANVYTDNTFTSWNNLHTVVGDAALYSSLARYFADMITDRNRPNYFRTTLSGKYKLYLYPRAPRVGTNTILLLDVLDNVSCTGVARGYGRKGRTVIRVAIWGWSAARTNLARKLWQLHDRGCRVEVILNSGTSSPKVRAALLKRSSRSGVMPVHDAWHDRNKNGKAELYVHHKAMTINGRWFGRSTKVVYTGSQNYTEPGTRSNNEVVLRIRDNATVDAYGKNLNLIRDRHTKRLTKAF